MKSLAELEALRKSTLDKINLRTDREDGIRVVVGMATCGIASGARPVLTAFTEQVSTKGLNNVVVTQTGCIGLCQYEPIVEVYLPGQEKITYCKMSPERVEKVIEKHIIGGKPCVEYTIGEVENK